MDGRQVMAWNLPPERVQHWMAPGVSGKALATILAITSVAIFAWNLMTSFVKELDPVSGHYSISAVSDAPTGEPILGFEAWPMFLSIEGNRVAVADYWSCGVAREFYLKGNGTRESSRIVVTANPSRREEKSGMLARRKDGSLIYRFWTDDARVLVIEFRRVSNAATMLDNLGWR